MNTSEASFNEGEAAFNRGDYKAAYREYMPLAKAGHAGAQFGIATLYVSGLGVGQELETGIAWLRKSADQGYVGALVMLSGFYKRGLEVPQDLTEAYTLLKKAADTGDALGHYNFAVVHLTGELGKRDFSLAWKLLNKAAAQNFRAAQFNLGAMLLKGQGLPTDNVQAYMWFEIASSDAYPRDEGRPIGKWAEIPSEAVQIKTELENEMTPAQIKEAKKLARGWKPKK